MSYPQSVSCSAFDELVVADRGNKRVVVFSDSGDMVMAMGDSRFRGATLFGTTVFAPQYFAPRGDDSYATCVVFD